MIKKSKEFVILDKRGCVREFPVYANAFLNEDAVSFYLLGAYMTDGSVIKWLENKNTMNFIYKNVISSKDKDWIENIRDIICPNKPISKKKHSNCWVFSSNEMNCSNWLMSYGCVPKKSLILRLFKTIPKKYHRDFVRGVIDGDGNIFAKQYIRKNRPPGQLITIKCVSITSASSGFIDDICKMIPKNIFYTKPTHKPSTGGLYVSPVTGIARRITGKVPMHDIRFQGNSANQIIKWLYYDGCISMNRKRINAENLLKGIYQK